MIKNKKKKLNEIPDEKAFHEVLRVLIKKMDYKGVEILHGPDEQGKDLVFYQNDIITGKKIYYAVVAKLGKLAGATNAAPENLVNIKRQIELCFDVPYKDVIEKDARYVHRVWVANTGTISDKAKTQILEAFGDKKGLIERNVDFFPESKLIEWFDEYWPDYFKAGDPFVLEYCSKLKDKYEKLIELKSLGYQKEVRNLLDVFIEPTLVEEKTNIQKKVVELVERTCDEIITDANNYWITGTLGSGKSTLLRMQILKLIGAIEKEPSKCILPIVFRFKDLIQDDRIANIAELMIATLRESNTYGYEIDPEVWLNEGRCILFLDGYDEIHNHTLNEQVLTSVNGFINGYPNVKIVATSREKGLESIESKLSSFHRVEINQLNYKQMVNFIGHWFRERDKEKQAMQDVIRNTVLANKLPKTPMVMTLLAILVDEREIKELPANLTELYSMFTQLHLGRWDAARGIDNLFEYNIKSNILMNVAAWLHEDGRDKVAEDAIKHQIDDYAAQRGIEIDSNKLLNELVNRGNLLYKDEDGFFSFKHLSFQQYFTSLRWEQTTFSTAAVLKRALDPWWSNVVFFYVGKKKDFPDIINGLIKLEAKDVYEDINKICKLGQLLQAAYLTNLNTKKQAIVFAVDNYCNNFPAVYKKVVEVPHRHDLSEAFLMFIMKNLFAENFASATLKKAMVDAYAEMKISSDFRNKQSFMKLYYLAYVLSMIGDKSYLEELATHPADFDPLFSLSMDLDVEILDKEYGLKISQGIRTKLKKRVKKSIKYIRSLLKVK